MRHRLLGSTGLMVSELSLGSMTFGGGTTIGGIDQPTANDMVAMALEAGVNLFDTADGYSRGEAERMLGRALGSRRRDVVVATKVRLRTGRGPNDAGLSRAHIFAAIDASLERLGTDYVDLYQIHVPDTHTPLDETLRALEDLVRIGKVRYTGCCNYPAWQVMKAMSICDDRGWGRFASAQVHYSLAARDAERELIPLCDDARLGMLVWSPLAGGLLSGKFRHDAAGPEGSRRTTFDFPPVDRERAYRVVEVLRPVAERTGTSVAAVAIAWLLYRAAVSSVILGARRTDQLADTLRAADVVLTSAELATLDEESALPPEYPGWMVAHPWDDRMPPDPVRYMER